MKKTMFKLFATFTTLISGIYAGGDISPVESSIEPAVAANSGDTLSLVSMLVFVGLTVIIGAYFTKRESL